jgi:hypothetical protein
MAVKAVAGNALRAPQAAGFVSSSKTARFLTVNVHSFNHIKSDASPRYYYYPLHVPQSHTFSRLATKREDYDQWNSQGTIGGATFCDDVQLAGFEDYIITEGVWGAAICDDGQLLAGFDPMAAEDVLDVREMRGMLFDESSIEEDSSAQTEEYYSPYEEDYAAGLQEKYWILPENDADDNMDGGDEDYSLDY